MDTYLKTSPVSSQNIMSIATMATNSGGPYPHGDAPPPYTPSSSNVYTPPSETLRYQHSSTFNNEASTSSANQTNPYDARPRTDSGLSFGILPSLGASLPRPIAIPATSANLGSPFLRAFAPVLEEKYQMPREVFLRFLDDLNRAAVASPPVLVLGLAGDIVSMVPLATAQIVGNSVSAAATLTKVGMSKGRTELCIRKANRELFAPRGLRVDLVKLDVIARVAGIPILNDKGKIEKHEFLLRPLDSTEEQQSISAQERRLQALEPWIAPLDLTPLPELNVPDNLVSRMHAATSESQRRREEKKMIKDRTKSFKDWTKDSRKAQEEYEKDMAKIEKEARKAEREDDARKTEKRLRELEKKREKCEREFEKEMRKVHKDRVKDDKEEKGARRVLWILVRSLDDASLEDAPSLDNLYGVLSN